MRCLEQEKRVYWHQDSTKCLQIRRLLVYQEGVTPLHRNNRDMSAFLGKSSTAIIDSQSISETRSNNEVIKPNTTQFILGLLSSFVNIKSLSHIKKEPLAP